MTLGELTLSDTYRIETVRPLAIEAEVAGKLLDYPFRFLVEETSQQDMIQTVKGTYSRDKLLYTTINVCVDEANVSYYAEGIADALGLALDFRCDDFIPSQNFEESGMTYQDFIAALFGWTAKLPHRQVNVFIRGDTLHIIQRGQENAVTDITDWPHTRPAVDRRLIRSLWHSGRENESDQAHSDAEDAEDAPVPFTGTISLGEISRTYENGFLERETNENGATDYTYTDGYLTRKRTHNKDGSTSLTEYAYAKTGRNIYLFKETERTTEAVDDGREHSEYDWQDWDNPVSERVTYHAPLGMGWYATTVYVDGENTGSSLSQGKHSFADGNGRMGRMWHSLLLGKWNEIFYWLPIEELIRSRQQEYYDALGKSDRESDSSTFVELMLEIILDALRETTVVGNAGETVKKTNYSVQKLLDVLGDEELSAAQIMERLDLSHKPTFRKNYLNPALAQGSIEMTIPDKPNSRNQRYRRKQLDR